MDALTEDRKQLISVVIPCYNEKGNLPRVEKALAGVFAPLASHYDAEFLFIDDGSEDGTAAEIEKLAEGDSRVKLISFSRNFGKEIAMSAGIRHAKGSAVIMLDADLQHPPELIPLFLEKWRNGADVVVGVRANNKNYALVKRCGSALYYKLMKAVSKTVMVPRETDFRLIDRAVADAFNTFTERQRNTRALINWLGFKREYVEFDMNDRTNGGASYSMGKLFHLAIYSLVSHSLLPLRLAGYLGVFITFFSGLLGIAVFFERYVFNDAWHWSLSGAAQLSIINVFLIGIVLSCLGIIALYIENMQNETTNRPIYVIRSRKLKVESEKLKDHED
jgi:glycosyltransferase involved in cell wall biosynthesis